MAVFYHIFKDWSEVHRWFIRGYASQVFIWYSSPPVDYDVYLELSLDQSYILSEHEKQIRLFVKLAT
jgi:hypothetical protein